MLLLLGALTATASGEPERSLALLKRYNKRYVSGKAVTLLTALALGEQAKYMEAHALLRAEKLDNDSAALDRFVGEEVMADWLRARLRVIRAMGSLEPRKAPLRSSPARTGGKTSAKGMPKKAAKKLQPTRIAAVAQAPSEISDLPKLEARFDMAFKIANADAIEIGSGETDPVAFRLRGELVRLSLFEGFDELLCMQALKGGKAHWC